MSPGWDAGRSLVSGLRRRLDERWPELAATAAIGLAGLAVWPVGDYAIDDDWAYTRSLQILYETGRFVILDWNPMTLVTHLAWGWLFTQAAGFGFTVAKLSTVALLWLECMVLAALLRDVGARTSTIAAALLTLILGPLHLFQSFLYATDIPALAWSSAALLGYARALGRPEETRHGTLLLASLLAALAWGVRHSAVLVVPGVALYLALYDRGKLRSARILIEAFLAPALAIALFFAWLYGFHGPTEAWREASAEILPSLREWGPVEVGRMAVFLLLYLALFLLPLLFAAPRPRLSRPLSRPARVGVAASAALVALFTYVTWVDGTRFPFLRNKLTRFGFLSPNEVLLGDREALLGPGTALLLGGVLCLGAVLFLLHWAQRPDPEPRAAVAPRVARLLGCVLAVQLAYCAATASILFDRHLLLFAPAAIALFVAKLGPGARLAPIPFALVLAPLALQAVAGTRDLHAASRAAFAAGEALLAEGVDAGLVDAGYAFDGWHMYERSRREMREQGRPPRFRRHDPWYVQMVAPRILTLYKVSLSPRLERGRWAGAVSPEARFFAFRPRLEGHRVLRTIPWQGWWPPRDRAVYVLVDEQLEKRLESGPLPSGR